MDATAQQQQLFNVSSGPPRKIEQIQDKKLKTDQYPNPLRIYGHRNFFIVI